MSLFKLLKFRSSCYAFCLTLVLGFSGCAPGPGLDAFYKRGTDAYFRMDYSSAFKDFRYLADNNHPEGQYFLAKMYANGEGIQQDFHQASFWHFKAAEGGFVEAQHTLGLMYQFGSGVEQDIVEAKVWLGAAAESGYTPAQLSLADLLAQSNTDQDSLSQAYTWYTIVISRNIGQPHDVALAERNKIAPKIKREKRFQAERTARAWSPY